MLNNGYLPEETDALGVIKLRERARRCFEIAKFIDDEHLREYLKLKQVGFWIMSMRVDPRTSLQETSADD